VGLLLEKEEYDNSLASQFIQVNALFIGFGSYFHGAFDQYLGAFRSIPPYYLI